MSAKYWQRGETIDYTPTDDLANGDVVDLATRIGVAGNDIPAGETGAVCRKRHRQRNQGKRWRSHVPDNRRDEP